MTPVCPACRAPIGLDAYSCGRCGLAVRPTCADCGEPLQFPATECWYCRAPVEEPLYAELTEPVAVVRPPPTAPVERAAFRPPSRPPSRPAPPRAVTASAPAAVGREHVSAGRVIAEASVAALLLTIALLALEVFVPRYTSTSGRIDALERRSFDDLGFSIEVPVGWTIDTSARAAAFYSGETAGEVSTRGFRVSPTSVAFADVPDEAERIDATRFVAHDVVSTGRGTLGRRKTYERVFVVEGRRVEQHWVDLGRGRTLRLEFWSRAADDDAAAANARIFRTLEIG